MPNPTSERASARSPAIAATRGPNSPDAARSTKGLKASGGKLSWTSQLVSVSVRMRSGSAPRRPGPPRRPCHWPRGRPGPARGARTARRAWRRGRAARGRPPRPRHRRRPVRRQIRGDAAAHVGDVPDDVSPDIGIDEDSVDEQRRRRVIACVALVDVGHVAPAEADRPAREQSRSGEVGLCALCLGERGHDGHFTYQLSVCKEPGRISLCPRRRNAPRPPAAG